MRATVRPSGECARLVEIDSLGDVLELAARLEALRHTASGTWAHVVDIVPAARTVLVVTDGTVPLADLDRALTAVLDSSPTAGVGSRPGTTGDVEIAVRYAGADLGEVARLTGLTPGEVVEAHTGTPWRVAFTGFMPGFGYLVGGDPRLVVPRRDDPRTRVPRGSVALAGEFTGVYPGESPGGWQLIGVTDAALWDPERDPPALLVPGTSVRFVASDAGAEGS